MPPSKLVYSTGNIKGERLIVDIIDVGQGNTILVSYPKDRFMLVDAGSTATSTSGKPFKHANDYINKVVGKTAICSVVMTHGDEDHTAFIPFLDATQNPSFVVYGGQPNDYSDEVKLWSGNVKKNGAKLVGMKLNYSSTDSDADFGVDTEDLDDPKVMLLAANYKMEKEKKKPKDPNQRSLVLMITFGNQAIVLSGDANADTEGFIMQQVDKTILQKCTFLVPGHHGSYYSSSSAYIDILKPLYNGVSASGTHKGDGHPNCATMNLLLKHAGKGGTQHDVICSNGKSQPYSTSQTTSALYVTATNGDIRFITDGENVKIYVSTY